MSRSAKTVIALLAALAGLLLAAGPARASRSPENGNPPIPTETGGAGRWG